MMWNEERIIAPSDLQAACIANGATLIEKDTVFAYGLSV